MNHTLHIIKAKMKSGTLRISSYIDLDSLYDVTDLFMLYKSGWMYEI